MAIGLSLTPRSYNVDPTGRDYVLDPEPLLNVAERSFMSQKENLRNMAAVGQQGVALGEYIGARQQLGRVKAGLSELDVSDPLFAQKYSSLVADNPLAFTNERLAPVTKAAITPVLASAAQAMEDRAALERARVMAGYQRQAAENRYGYQKEIIDYRNENPPPEKPRAVGAADQLWNEDGVTSGGTSGAVTPPPQAASPAAPSPSGQPGNTGILPVTGDLPPTNTGEMSTDIGARLLQQGVIPEPPPFSDANGGDASGRMVVGEGDGPDDVLLYNQNNVEAPIQAVRKYIPGTGWAVTKKVTPEGRSIDIVNDAATPTNPPQPGYMYVAEVPNEYSGRPGGWKQVPITPALVEERKAVIKNFVATDPNIASLKMNAAALKAQVDAATAGLKSLPAGDQPGQQGPAAKTLVDQAAAAAVATASADAAEAQMNLNLTIGGEEALLTAYNNRVVNQKAQAIPQQGTGETWAGNEEALLNTPAATMPSSPQTAQQIVAQRQAGDDGTNRRWNAEKKFVSAEADRIDATLEFPPGTLLRAVSKNDVNELNAILAEMERRGIKSPLFVEGQRRPAFGPFGVTIAPGRMEFASSPLVNQSYRNVLTAVAQEKGQGNQGVSPSNNPVRIGSPFTKN